MRLNTIVKGILTWVQSVFGTQKTQSKYALVVLEQISSPRGIIQLIDRDTERAIATWRFVPHRDNGNAIPRDILLCVDDLSPWGNGKTHTISILEISHWVGGNGHFEAVGLHVCNYDLSGPGVGEHRWARAILKNLALTLLRKNVADWDFEVRFTCEMYLHRKQSIN